MGTPATVIVPNISDLEAFPTSGFETGQPAIVQSNGSAWNWVSTTGLTTDGITIVNGVTGQWTRNGSTVIQQALAQTTWKFNASTGNDENDGATNPLKTWGEYVRRVGGIAPQLQALTYTFTWGASSPSSDLVNFMPIIPQGCLVFFVGQTSVATSGTLASTVQLDRSTGTLLQANLGAGATSYQGYLLENTTRGGICFIDSFSGSVATLTQPTTMSQTTPTPPTLPAISPTLLTNYANGDAFEILSIPQVYFGVLKPQGVGSNANEVGFVMYVENLWAGDASETNSSCLFLNHSIVFCSCRRDAFVVYDGVSANDGQINGNAINCWDPSSGSYNGWGPVAGAVNTLLASSDVPVLLVSCRVTGDILLHGQVAVQANPNQSTAETVLANVYLDNEIDIFGITNIADDGGYSGQCLYGTYTLDVQRGAFCRYNGSASGASGAFQGSPTLQIQASGTAYSLNGTTFHSGVSITPANLDAAAGATGFGGTAFDPRTSACITNLL